MLCNMNHIIQDPTLVWFIYLILSKLLFSSFRHTNMYLSDTLGTTSILISRSFELWYIIWTRSIRNPRRVHCSPLLRFQMFWGDSYVLKVTSFQLTNTMIYKFTNTSYYGLQVSQSYGMNVFTKCFMCYFRLCNTIVK